MANKAGAKYQWQWSSNGTDWTDCDESGSDTDTLGLTTEEELDGRMYCCVVTSVEESICGMQRPDEYGLMPAGKLLVFERDLLGPVDLVMEKK